MIGEQEDRRQRHEQALNLLNEPIRELREKLLAMPDLNLGIESLSSFQVRESFGEILQCAKSLRKCNDRLILLMTSHDEAILALTRGQADLMALGEIIYRDRNGVVRRTGFLWYWDEQSSDWLPVQDAMNYED